MKRFFSSALFALILCQNSIAAESSVAGSLDGTEWQVLQMPLWIALMSPRGYYGGYEWQCDDGECLRAGTRYENNIIWSIDSNGHKIIEGKTLPRLGIGYYRWGNHGVSPMFKYRGEFVPTCATGWYTLRDADNRSSKIYQGDDPDDLPEQEICYCAVH